MALTQEQINAARSKAGLQPLSSQNTPKPLAERLGLSSPGHNYSNEFKLDFDAMSDKKREGNVKMPGAVENPLTAEDYTSVIGGQKLAEGLGNAIAAPKVQRDIDANIENISNTQTQLIQRLKSERAEGKDTTETKKLLKDTINNMNAVIETNQNFQDVLPTNKEVVGSALRLAGTAAGGALVKGASAITGAAKGASALKGIGAGALAGATEGAIQGAGMGAEENESASGIAKSALEGSAIGGALGGVAGGLIGKKPSLISKEDKATKKAIESIMEKPNKKSVISSFEKGNVKEVGRGKKFEIAPSKRDIEVYESVKPYIEGKGNPVRDIQSLNQAIPKKAMEVENYLKANPRAFNTNQVSNKLNSLEMPDLFKTDESLEKTYNLVRQRMIERIKANTHDMEGLWKARKEFDSLVEDQFGDAVFDTEKNTAIKRAIKDMRNSVNDYIAESIGDDTFKKMMRDMSNVYEARYNIAEKAYDAFKTSKWARWKKENPGWFKVLIGLGSAAGLGGATALGANVVDAATD